MDCLVQQPVWTGAYHHRHLPLSHHHHHHFFSPYYFPKKRTSISHYYPASSYNFPSKLDNDVGFPADIKVEASDECLLDDDKDEKICVVCGEKASGYYFGALVCLPCKSFYIRCTKEGEPTFTCQCNGNCDIAKQGRIRCQYCRYQRCLMAGMCRKEKPETVQPAEGQVLCKVCGDIANGIHFGVNTCEGCKKFFRRGLVENQSYVCKGDKKCTINPRNRNNCRFCRYQKCITVGMSREAIKMGRPKKSDNSDGLLSCSPGADLSDLSEESNSPHSSLSEMSPHSSYDSGAGSPMSQHESDSKSVDEPSYIGFLLASKKIKTESHDSACEQTDTKRMSMPTDLLYTQLTPMSDHCSMGSNTSHCSQAAPCWTTPASSSTSINNWHAPITSSTSARTPCAAPIPSSNMGQNQPTAQPSALSFMEEEMDEILDYLQTEQTIQAQDKVPCTTPRQPQQNFNYYPNNFPTRSPCMMDRSGCPVPPQHMPVETTTDHTSPTYPDPSSTSVQYPNSPNFSDSPINPTQYQMNSPSHSPIYPHSPGSTSQYCPSPSNPCPGSPGSTSQYMSSPANSPHYSGPQFHSSPVHSAQYPSSPSSNCMYPDSPHSSCQYSPPPQEPIHTDCQQYPAVIKAEFPGSMPRLHPSPTYTSTTDGFSRSR
ncbi:DNA-directed RNA polymerase II subunit RPB1-like [Mizuhopecten yessoensis]|uniref:Retinoic acid receptor RXR n=1 Tax=Mizuhopecten yessoensis TaxID=6573 RepID=A0A210PP82_MIZYE|nr:DNA-directed RNA polymerase II subunit RPB1-like [Mizuhopecten yessoensis]OWF38246.1 Retinoic acid receptor RXR [Mizuhopecten yessoensis]